MQKIIHFAAILLVTALFTACTSEANRFTVEPVEDTQLSQDNPAQHSLQLVASSAGSTPGEVKDFLCNQEGVYYKDERIDCGPVIRTPEGKIYLPVPNELSLAMDEIDRPMVVEFAAVPTKIFDTGVGDIEICERLEAIYLTCLTVR